MAGWLRLVLAFYFLGTIMAIPGSILLVEYEKHFYQQHRNAICNEKNGRGSQDSCERKARDEAADAYSPFPNIQIGRFILIDLALIVISFLMLLTVLTTRWVHRGFERDRSKIS